MQNTPLQSNKDRVSIRVDHQRRLDAQTVAENMGSDLSTVINMFLSQMIKENGLPFRPTNQISELDEALAEMKHPETLKVYDRTSAMAHLKDLRAEAHD